MTTYQGYTRSQARTERERTKPKQGFCEKHLGISLLCPKCRESLVELESINTSYPEGVCYACYCLENM